MLLLLKEYAGGELMVGNNGYVWISETSGMPLLLKTLKLIERKAHKSGLTDEVAALLSKETGRVAKVREIGESSEEGASEYGSEEETEGNTTQRSDDYEFKQ
jgi:exosome complex RNA-binding protein Rrp4